jgi:hypothetical protein
MMYDSVRCRRTNGLSSVPANVSSDLLIPTSDEVRRAYNAGRHFPRLQHSNEWDGQQEDLKQWRLENAPQPSIEEESR